MSISNDFYKDIESIYDGSIIFGSVDIVIDYVLDIVFPDKKLAIIFEVLSDYSVNNGCKKKKYHIERLKACNDAGYRLITVFEDEYINRPTIVMSRVKNILGMNTGKKIYARKCVITEIEARDARVFCDSFHLQGYTGASIKLGAFYGSQLVSVMTFHKPSRAKGNKHTKEGEWELSRFCTDVNFRAIGIASKLLKNFERNYGWNKILTFADLRWSDGGLYNKLGFDYTYTTDPNYWYFKDVPIRMHRFIFRKNVVITKFKDELDELGIDPLKHTEMQMMTILKWDYIWDCGNLRFIKSK